MHSQNHISHNTCLSILLNLSGMKYSRTNVHKQQQSQVGGYSQHGGLYWIYAAMEWWMQSPHNGITGGFVANAAGKDKISGQFTVIIVIYLNAYPEHGLILKTVRLFNSLGPSGAYMRRWYNHHWFRQWLVAWSAPSHYLNQCWTIVC